MSDRKYMEWFSPDTPFEDCKKYVEYFLINTPALETSCRSEGWITRYKIDESDSIDGLFEFLTEGINYYHSENSNFAESSKELVEILEKNNKLYGEFWEGQDFIIFAKPTKDYNQIKKLVEQKKNIPLIIESNVKGIYKYRFQQLNSLFTHLRNALAHGAFCKKQSKKGYKYIFQDFNKDGNLRARIVVKEQTLDRWISTLTELEYGPLEQPVDNQQN